MNELDTFSLHDLISRFQAGDNGALDSLVRRTEQRLKAAAGNLPDS